MFILYSKAQRINKLSCMFVAGRDGCTANAEHLRQQRRHIYIVYVPPHAPCPWFGMSAMFRAMAAEVRWVLICTSIFQGCWGLKFVSQALDLLFECSFLHATWVGLCLGVLNPVFQLWRVGIWPLSLYLTSWYEFVLWGSGISKLVQPNLLRFWNTGRQVWQSVHGWCSRPVDTSNQKAETRP